MSNHLSLVRQTIGEGAIRATGEAIGIAVAVTDTELVTGKAGFLSRWGNKVQRYSLSSVLSVRKLRDPHTSLLQVEIGGPRPCTITFLYEPTANADFEQLETLLAPMAARAAAAE